MSKVTVDDVVNVTVLFKSNKIAYYSLKGMYCPHVDRLLYVINHEKPKAVFESDVTQTELDHFINATVDHLNEKGGN